MNNSKPVRRLTIIGAAVFAFSATAVWSASAEPAPPDASIHAAVSERMPCGWLGDHRYRHCDPATTVNLDVRDIWGGIETDCVGYGITDLQPGRRWAVVDAWWNGGVGCHVGN